MGKPICMHSPWRFQPSLVFWARRLSSLAALRHRAALEQKRPAASQSCPLFLFRMVPGFVDVMGRDKKNYRVIVFRLEGM